MRVVVSVVWINHVIMLQAGVTEEQQVGDQRKHFSLNLVNYLEIQHRFIALHYK